MSEVGAQSKSTAGEVVMSRSSVPNGAISSDTIEFLEEHDPMADITANTEDDVVHSDGEEELADDEIVNEEHIEEVEEEELVYEEVEVDDEVEEDADGELEGEAEEEVDEDVPIERTPTQVPKKRKIAAMLAAEEEEEELHNENVLPDDIKQELEEEEQPTSSVRAGVKKNDSVDEEQCRVCTAKEDLVSLFKKNEQLTIADMLMTICPTVSIARKDFMPQFICNTCLDNCTIAVQLKMQCETTEKELRKQLSRHKNKVRRPAGYVVIDAPAESDPPSEDEANDDVEFKVSDEASPSADDDSEDSDFSGKRRRVVRGASARRGRRKSAVVTPPSKGKEKKRVGRPPMKRETSANGSSDEETGMYTQHKKIRTSTTDKDSADDKPTEFPCDECEQVFTRKLSLVLHKKAHGNGRKPINCVVCGKQFKIKGAYRTHLEKHKDDSLNGHGCGKCDKVYTSKAELRRHLIDEHGMVEQVHQCNKCKRTFVSEVRLARHKEGRCPGYETKQRKNDYESFSIGKDLFKAVAPLTTTYWSDSFSD